jgi:CheY-like chemotaxis protein
MSTNADTLLGQLLLNYGMITRHDLEAALDQQEASGEPVGEALVSMDVIEPEELELALRAQARLQARPGRSLPHVLIVDDDPEVGAVLSEILIDAGYSTGVAQNAAEATAAVTSVDATPPVLLVLDLRLPGIGGLTLLARLRRIGCRVPVVVLTGYPELETEVYARDLQVARVVEKPVSARHLVTVVDEAIRGRVSAEVT